MSDTDDDIPDVPDIETVEEADEMLPNADGSDDNQESALSAAGDGVSEGFDADRIGSAAERGAEAVTSAASAGGYAAGVASGLAGVMLKTAKLIPKQSRLFRRLAISGMKGYYKRSGADALGIEARPNGELDLVPVSYLASEVTEEGQRPGWQVHGRDRSYDAASMGDSVHYLKDTPLVPLHSDATVESTWMAPRIAEAVELEQYWPIFRNPTFNPVFNVPGRGRTAGNDAAWADGGQLDASDQFSHFEISDPGHYAGDAVVDLNSDDGHDGMRISFSKAQDILDERTTSERMDMQEQRGRIMSQLQGGKKEYAMKMLLIAATAIVLSILAVTIGPELVGGGGGGGSISPLLALPLGV